MLRTIAIALTLAACTAPLGATVAVELDMVAPWPMHTIAGYATGLTTLRGADGTDPRVVENGKLHVASGWEESGVITDSEWPGCGDVSKGPWPTNVLPGRDSGVEDAIYADLDGDGTYDMIGADQGGFRLSLRRSRAGNPVFIAAATNVARWTRVLAFDLDGDGRLDVAACGQAGGTGGSWISYFTSPTPWIATSWTRHDVGRVGACQEFEVRDVDRDGRPDLVVGDRDTIPGPNYTLRGVRWLQNPGGPGAWVNHEISHAPPANTRWHWMSDDARHAVIGTACGKDCGGGPNVNTLALYDVDVTGAWVKTDLVPPDNVGWYQASAVADIDGDGLDDIVITHAYAVDGQSGVVWLRNNGDGTYTRGEVSGPLGTKYDNVQLIDIDCDGDLDILTSEQGNANIPTPPEQILGVLWLENKQVP